MNAVNEVNIGGCPLEAEVELHYNVQSMINNGISNKEEFLVSLEALKDMVRTNGGENATAVVDSIDACILRYSNDTSVHCQTKRIANRCFASFQFCGWKRCY